MASTYLTRTPSSTGNRKTWTFSAWFKKFETGVQHRILSVQESGDERLGLYFSTSDQMVAELRFGGVGGTGLTTNQLFRDTSGWYHVVWSVDTTQATASDRAKLYINGEQITSFSASGYPAQNANTATNYTVEHRIGKSVGFNNPFNGLMSHIHLTDGTTYDATAFGEYDANGVWKIKTSPSVNYGTNGFFILKNGNSVTDQSGNSNNFTVGGGTLTNTEDSPSNVFATLNSLDNYYASTIFSNGNTSQTSNAGAYAWVSSTLGMTSGKFYAECKQTGFSGGSNYNLIGVVATELTSSSTYLGGVAGTSGYYAQGNVYNGSGSATSTYNSYTTNDIIGVAIDLDNNKLYFSKNGTWQNSGVPTSGSTGTGALSLTAVSSTNKGAYFFASGDYGNTVVVNNSWNFGNGYFGTTAVSSAGTNASGNGIFEFDCPTGYTALSTKGLNL